MPDYDLSGLSWRSFEQLVQSVSSELFGGRLVEFGDGPDGGREAAFEGHVQFPTPDTGWTGYGVVQAKFRQRSAGLPTDSDWFLAELKKEIDAYLKPASRRRKPEFLLVATNVALTAATGGGRDRATSLLKSKAKELGLKDFAIWDYNDVRTFLDRFDAIRTSYAAFVTEGDVLASALAAISLATPEFESTLANFLQKELLSDQFANLEQSGHTIDDKIPIARVFIDLPARTWESEDHPDAHFGIVQGLLAKTQLRLKPILILGPSAGSSRLERDSRVVVIGGPGQGKTTLGQYLCQLLRVSILKDRVPHELMQDAKDVCESITDFCREEGLELPRARRFPMRVVLAEFAEALAAQGHGALSLLSYLCSRVAVRTDRSVSLDTFRAWLASYPWLLVLDGLDEVPGTSNRVQLMTAIREFLVDVQQIDADVLVVATTRPQGYSEEFAPERFQHLALSPLSPEEALKYASRLVGTRYGNDLERREKILTRLARAADEEATAHLMESPLQVTIMATLVDQTGQPPQERWNLFHQYYDVIYRREMERDIPVAALLRTQRPNIDAIHRSVGLLLHLASEQQGSTDARMPVDRFARIVEARLRSEGYEGEALTDLTKQVMQAATQRLVFLVGVQAGRVGFEIRSLQEFMAAEGLTDGTDSAVARRLREIAPLPHWRNTFLFAAGRVFIDKQHMRETLFTICAELDEGPDHATSGSLAGSRLAIDLLEDGSATQQPKWARLLARQALRILDLPPCDDQVRLAFLCAGHLKQIYHEEIHARLTQQPLNRQLGAWVTVLVLSEDDAEFDELASQFLPQQKEELNEIFSAVLANHESWSLINRFIDVLPQFPPFQPLLRPGTPLGKEPPGDFPAWLTTAVKVMVNREIPSRIIASLGLEGSAALSLQLGSPATQGVNALAPLKDLPPSHHAWEQLRTIGRFADEPTADNLARELERLGGIRSPSPWDMSFAAPWPLAACLALADDDPDLLRTLASRAALGELGDVGDWIDAENRWRNEGITRADILHMTDECQPFDNEIAQIGFPVILSSWIGSSHGADFLPLLQLLGDASGKILRERISGWVLTLEAFRFARGPSSLSGEDIVRLFESIGAGGYEPVTAHVLRAIADADMPDSRKVEVLNRAGDSLYLFRAPGDELPSTDEYVRLATLYPDAYGIYEILAEFVEAGVVVDRNLPLPKLASSASQGLKRAVLLLRLATELSDDATSEDLARAIAATPLSPYHFAVLISNMNVARLTPEGEASFLEAVRRNLPAEQWERRGEITDAILGTLSRRTSSLTSRDVWSALELPDELLELVANGT